MDFGHHGTPKEFQSTLALVRRSDVAALTGADQAFAIFESGAELIEKAANGADAGVILEMTPRPVS